jgi:hypothetical protein
MEHSGISVEAGPPDQLDEEVQLDFDPNVELEDEDFDFGLDRSYEQAEHALAEGSPSAADALGYEAKAGDADQGTRAATDDNINTAEGAEDAGNDVGAEVDYQDEIGYEDDDLVATDINADLNITETGDAEVVELPNDLPEGDSESARLVDASHTEALTPGPGESWNQDISFEDHAEGLNVQEELVEPNEPGHGESLSPQDQLANPEEGQGGSSTLEDEFVQLDEHDGEEDTAERLEGDDLTADNFDDETTHEQFGIDHHTNDLDDVLDDLSQSLPRVPDIEVVYNDECYSLLGTSDDDPESYFLSEAKELDRPLSQFLSALRAVIANEIAPTDELVIRFDPLELEFGEHSNKQFLSRSFRELLDCHATLGRVPGTSADPVIQLMVRRDSEEHFLELLAQAELVKGSTSGAEDSEMSENVDEGSPTDALDDEQMQDETFDGEDLNEYDEGEHAAGSDDAEADAEADVEPDLQTPPSKEEEAASESDQRTQASPSQSPDNPAETEAFDNGEHLAKFSAEETSHEVPEDSTGDKEAWDEPQTRDDATIPQHAETTFESSDEQILELTEQQEDVESLETADSSVADKATANGTGGFEQDAGSNGKYSSFIPPTQEEFWEIDYSDDEDEPTPLDNPEDGAQSLLQLHAQDVALDPKWVRANSAGSFHTNKTSESGDVSMTYSFDVDANNHQDDLILTFDDDSGLPTIEEEVHEYEELREDEELHEAEEVLEEDEEEYTITYDVSENPADDDGDTQELDVAETANDSASKNSESSGRVAAAAETASIHTSTTINGDDEINYDDEDAVDYPSAPADDGTQQPTAASGMDNDEIGWENDEDEYEQQPASGDDNGGTEESMEAALTPPSVAGKRSRTDEAESLADETGMCRVPKRARLC